MPTRSDDPPPTGPGALGLPRVYVNRVLPLWSIIVVISMIIGFGVRLSYQVDNIAKEQAATSADVKAIKEQQEVAGRKQFESGWQMGDMNRRLMNIEDRLKNGGRP